eukprot:scaffold3059_cov251-Chaetoceros_neogracile.AAC.2
MDAGASYARLELTADRGTRSFILYAFNNDDAQDDIADITSAVESEEEEEEFVNATTLDYDPFSSNANEETLEDFADSMDEEEEKANVKESIESTCNNNDHAGNAPTSKDADGEMIKDIASNSSNEGIRVTGDVFDDDLSITEDDAMDVNEG